MNPLLALLSGAFGQQGTTPGQTPISGYDPAKGPPIVDQRPPADTEEVTVEASRYQPPRSLGNLEQLLEQQAARQEIEAAYKLPKGDPGRLERPSGPFGVKGTLRDILGTIGDAFLIQHGAKPMYAPKKEQERIAMGMAGFTQDPLAAAERVGQFDPVTGQKIADSYQDNQVKQAQVRSVTDARESAAAKRDFDMREAGLNRITRWVRGGASYAQVVAAAREYGITEEQLKQRGLKPDMTKEERAIFGSQDVNVNQQEMLPRRDRQLDIAQQNADANTTRANRPPAGRAPSRPTASNVDAEVLQAVMEGRATPQQQKYYDTRLRRPEGRSGRRTGTQSPQGGKLRIRGGVVQ